MASRQVYVNDLATVDTIARRKKMSVGHVSNIVKGKITKKKGFPQPIVGWGCRGVWLWSDVDEWFKTQEVKEAKQKENKMRYKNQHLAATA